MKKIVFVLMMLGAGKCFGQWQTVLDSSLYRFSNVYFINNDTGFVCGEKSVPPYNRDIARTMDGGQTWDFTSINNFFMSIQFVNDSVGFAGGQDGYIYKTTNMGNTWNMIGDVFPMSDQSAFYFINSQVGYSTSFYGGIRRTTDGGLNWIGIGLTSGKSYFPGTAKFFFVDSSIGFVAQSAHGQQGINGKAISKTIDGGATWADLPIPADFNPYSCFFFDSLSGFSVGYHGKVTKTNDGGLTWTAPDSICPYPLYDIAFVNDSIGYITGGGNVYDFGNTNGIIFKTIDRGNTWQVMDSSYSNGLSKMYFPSNNVGYIAGMGGIVLKLTDANYPNSGISQIHNPQSTIQIYPNPTTGKLTIETTTNKIESIKILNVLGEEIIEKRTGSNDTKYELDLKDTAKGIYFVRVVSTGSTTERNVVNRKIVVQ